MTADVALGDIEWLGQRRTVEIILSKGEDALIGTEMLGGAMLVIDYDNRSVSITKQNS
jgi:predicted aspartyl protease